MGAPRVWIALSAQDAALAADVLLKAAGCFSRLPLTVDETRRLRALALRFDSLFLRTGEPSPDFPEGQLEDA